MMISRTKNRNINTQISSPKILMNLQIISSFKKVNKMSYLNKITFLINKTHDQVLQKFNSNLLF